MSFLRDIIGTVASVAPSVASALGGPLAGTAIKVIGGALGLPQTATEKEVVSAVKNATPEQLADIRKADQAFEQKMREMDIDLTKAYIEDTADARENFSADSKVFWLGIAVLLTFGASCAGILLGYVPSTVSEVLLGTVIGYVAANANQVISFYFGSSQGSAQKTAAMNKAILGDKK